MGLTSVETSETALPLDLTVDQLSSGGVVGLAPTVSVRNVSAGSPFSSRAGAFRQALCSRPFRRDSGDPIFYGMQA